VATAVAGSSIIFDMTIKVTGQMPPVQTKLNGNR